MQNITDLQKTLQPVFERHYTEKVYLTNAHNNSLNFYVVGCTRVGLTALKNDISSILCCRGNISVNHVEADMMIDSIIRNDGILIYDASCECLQ